MSSLKNQIKDKEEKYNRFKKDIQNERMFLFKVNNLFTDEFEEMIDDILILNEAQFMSQLKNRIESELEEIYSDKISSEKKLPQFLEKGIKNIKEDYKSNYELLFNTYDYYTKNKNTKKSDIEYLTNKYRRHCIREVQNEHATHTCNSKLGKFILAKKKGKIKYDIVKNKKKKY